MQKILIIFILFFISKSYLQASDLQLEDSLENKSSCWLALGIGNNYFGPNLSANLSYTFNQNLFTIKYSKSDEFRFGVENNFDEPSLEIKEYAILYGRTFRENILLFSVSAGVSYLKGVNRGKNIQYNNFEKVNISTIGFPFEAEAMFEFTNYFGIGILFYGNLNKEKVFGGVMLRLKIGWF